MNTNDKTFDGLRIQIADPCVSWEEKYEIEYYDCGYEAKSHFEITRANCQSDKIVGWFESTGETNVGSHDSGQVVVRLVNDCDETETRDGDETVRFETNRYLSTPPNSNGASLTCANNSAGFLGFGNILAKITDQNEATGTCSGGTTYYLTGESTPIQDIDTNKNALTKVGLYTNEPNDRPYVQYGTKQIGQDGDILADCVTNTDDMFFLYIPCWHYQSFKSSDNPTIKKNAFKDNGGLVGVWINGSWGCEYDGNDGPFNGCNNIEIVYCPRNWVDYFKTFKSIKYINGKPYEWDENDHICKELKPTSCDQ